MNTFCILLFLFFYLFSFIILNSIFDLRSPIQFILILLFIPILLTIFYITVIIVTIYYIIYILNSKINGKNHYNSRRSW
jgi:hypothetical protein